MFTSFHLCSDYQKFSWTHLWTDTSTSSCSHLISASPIPHSELFYLTTYSTDESDEQRSRPSNVSNTLKLNCLVLGQDSSHIFLIRIPANQTVYDLKEAVKDKNQQTFRDIDADGLQLFKVSIPVNKETDKTLATFKPHQQHLDNVNLKTEELSLPLAELSEVFSEPPVLRHLHIVVKSPIGMPYHSSVSVGLMLLFLYS
jgi:Crinkler effector protein N-terminal domain